MGFSRKLFLFIFLFTAPLSAYAAANAANSTNGTIPSVGASNTGILSQSHYTRIFYFREGPNARTSFFTNAPDIDVFAPQTYSIDGTGALSGSVAPDLLSFAKANRIKVMPLVTNKAFSTANAEQFLDSPTEQASAIAALAAEAQKYGYWGWQLDFEQMPLQYRDKFSQFVINFGAAMKQAGLVSSVAVVSEVSENPSDYPKNLWQTLIGVYDYSVIGANVNIVTIMAYDDPNSNGPIAEWTWLKQVLGFSLSQIPADKISLGLPLYYWQWNVSTGKLVGIGGYADITTDLIQHHAKEYYSAAAAEPYLLYSVKVAQAVRHYILWFEDYTSVSAKIALIKADGLNGFSAWALGEEAPSVYRAMEEK